jgi:hypothetical protein
MLGTWIIDQGSLPLPLEVGVLKFLQRENYFMRAHVGNCKCSGTGHMILKAWTMLGNQNVRKPSTQVFLASNLLLPRALVLRFGNCRCWPLTILLLIPIFRL